MNYIEVFQKENSLPQITNTEQFIEIDPNKIIEGTNIPSTGDPEKDKAIKYAYDLQSKDKPLEIVSPEFYLLTGVRGIPATQGMSRKEMINSWLVKGGNPSVRNAKKAFYKFGTTPYGAFIYNLLNPFM